MLFCFLLLLLFAFFAFCRFGLLLFLLFGAFYFFCGLLFLPFAFFAFCFLFFLLFAFFVFLCFLLFAFLPNLFCAFGCGEQPSRIGYRVTRGGSYKKPEDLRIINRLLVGITNR